MSIRRTSLAAFTAAAIALGASAAPASADVLVEALPSSIPCGKSIGMAVWYQSYSGGSHRAVLEVRSANGKRLWRKRVRATTTWRTYRYHPRCRRTYRARYEVPGGVSSYRVRVRG